MRVGRLRRALRRLRHVDYPETERYIADGIGGLPGEASRSREASVVLRVVGLTYNAGDGQVISP